MPSGKQTSFQYGEISPVNQYRSNDAEYSSALHSLYNMTVKRQGGIQKMPGARLSNINPHYDNAPAGEISYQRYKILPFTYENAGVRQIGIFSLHIEDDLNDDLVTLRIKGTTNTSYRVNSGEGLAGVKSTYTDGVIFIHGLKILDNGAYRFALIRIDYLDDASPTITIELAPTLPAFSVPTTKGSAKLTAAPVAFTGVQYLITAEFSNGLEIPMKRMESAAYDANGFMAFNGTDHMQPGDGVITGFSTALSFLAIVAPRLKAFRIYRAAVTGNSNSGGSMSLVAKIPVDVSWISLPAVGTYFFTVSLNDTGASVPSETPPIDVSVFVNHGGLDFMEGTSCSAVYQERHIVGFNIFNNPKILPGGMAVTAVGSASQFARPVISKNTGAFGMSIPSADGSPVRALIAAERLIAFSDKGTYVIQGGESGILTPTSINPVKLSDEGSSKYVQPLIVGGNIVYLNSSHTKLMSVVFGDNFQSAVVELASLSDHLFKGDDFIEMQVLPGADDIVLLLKQGGDLISVEVNELGIAGPSRICLEGSKVESISTYGPNSNPILIMSVIRNGIRVFETIADSSDVKQYRKQSYTNSSVQIGTRLLAVTEKGYPKMPTVADTLINPEANIQYRYLNITTATDFNAGSELTITSDHEIGAGFIAEFDKIKCYYTEDGVEKFLFLTLTNAGVPLPPWAYTAVADIDVPAYLQNVEGNGALTAEEKLVRSSNWLPVTTKLKSTGDVAGLWPLYLLLKEGASVDPTVTPDGEVDVAIYADNKIFSSPLNSYMPTIKLVKVAGQDPYVLLPEPVAFAEVGVPYEAYMQTLPIEVGEGRTLTDDKKIVNKVGIALYNTIGGFVGLPNLDITKMAMIKTRDNLNIGEADTGFSGYLAPTMPSGWSKEGMIAIKQVDPAPMTILSVYPKGMAGD